MIKRDKNTLLIGSRLTIRATRFPWQIRSGVALLSSTSERQSVGKRYGWRGTDGMGRFGGGWNWNLGIAIGCKTVMIHLLVGTITISWHKPKA